MRISKSGTAMIAATKRLGLAIGLWAAAGAVLAVPAVVDFGPVDSHRGAKQIQLRFSDDMVALGDDKAADPADVVCRGTDEVPRGHWLDGKRWVAEFKAPLDDGIACEVKPHALQTLKGETVAIAAPWHFDTGGPRINFLFDGSAMGAAKEEPVLAFLPSASLDMASLQYLACKVNQKSTPITLLSGAERDTAIKRVARYRINEADKTKWMALRCGDAPWPADAELEMVIDARIASAAQVRNKKDESFKFRVRPAFAAQFSCMRLLSTDGCDPRGQPPSQTRYGPKPQARYSLNFLEPIAYDTAEKIKLIDESGQAHPAQAGYRQDHVQTVSFEGNFVEGQKLRLQLPDEIRDVDGRLLTNRDALSNPFPVARLPAYVGMPKQMGILPWTPGKSVAWPVATRGLEAQIPVAAWHFAADNSDDATLLKLLFAASTPVEDVTTLSEKSDTPYAASLRLLDKLARPVPAMERRVLHPTGQSVDFTPLSLTGYGMWLVEADSPAYRGVVAQQRAALGQESTGRAIMPQQWADSRFAVAQLTNLRVETLNSADGDSLIWVTAIDNGEPVSGAHVDLWIWDSGHPAKLGSYVSDAQGRVTVPVSAGWNASRGQIPMMIVRNGQDMFATTAHAGWSAQELPLIHTLFDRVLLHPGETVSLQHIVRQLTRRGLVVPVMDDQWKLQIYAGWSYGGEKPVYETALHWSETGDAGSRWKIPANAKLGNYTYRLVHKGTQNNAASEGGGSFQVEEFRTPSFDADLQSKTVWSGKARNVDLLAALSYLSGGAAAGQEVRIKGTYNVSDGSPIPGYVFFQPPPDAKPPVFDDIKLSLDDKGHALAHVAVPAFAWPLSLDAEMSFSDPNGEIKSEQTYLRIWPQQHKLGMALERSGNGQPVNVKAIALDEREQPLVGETVTVDLVDAKNKSTRACRIKTDAAGKGECRLEGSMAELIGMQVAVEAEGASGVTLKIADHLPSYQGPKQREHQTLELEQKRPLIGAPLRVQVHSSVLPATLLLTVERQGIQRSLVRKIAKSEEIIELPTGGEDAPSVMLRAILVPGADAKPVDGEALAGGVEEADQQVWFAEASGGLTLTVKPAQATALPGSSVAVALKAKLADSGKPAAHAHVTVVAVDDALLALRPNNTWDLLTSYWHRARSDAAFTSSAGLIVGADLFASGVDYFPMAEAALERDWVPDGMEVDAFRRRRNLEADLAGRAMPTVAAPAPASVGGVQVAGNLMKRSDARSDDSVQRVAITGSNITRADQEEHVKPRSNFSTLALWRTDVVLDEHGEATVNVPLPDTLTRWYIAAIATSGAARFGMDHGNVTTSQPVQILSGLPQSVRSEDVLVQKLTLRNTTDKPLTLNLAAQAKGKRDDNVPGTRDPMPASALEARGLKFEKRMILAAGENKIIEWKVAVPDGVTSLEWTIAAHDAKGHPLDSLVQTQTVTAPVPVTVREAMLFALDAPKNISVAQPSGAKPGLGGLAVHWQSSLVDAAMDGTRRAMADYPYGCMEQLASKAVVSGEPEQWKKLMAKLPSMLDSQGLVRYFPETPGSEVLTAYLIDIAEAYGLALPQAEEQRMRAALRVALANEVSRDQAEWLEERGRLARRLALQATLAPDLGKTAPTVPAELDKLPTIALVDWLRYVLKQPESGQRSQWLEAASDELRNRYDMQGTRLSLRPNPNDHIWWFMWNDDVAQARAALLIERNLAQQARWQGLMPGLVSGLVDRQHGGQWHTTVANAWSGAAMLEFAKRNEHGPVDGASFAGFGGKGIKSIWPDPAPALLPWPQQGARGDLDLRHEGGGAPWATVQVMAAVDTPQAVSHGLSVKKIIEPLEQKIKGRWSVGDILRVKLVMQSDAKLSWLAVRDPIPSGATIQGKGLKGETEVGHPNGWLWWWRPSSAELGNESYRGYYQFVWSGAWESDYVLRLNNAGTFTLPPTRIEAMYAPEIFGETPNAVMEVGP